MKHSFLLIVLFITLAGCSHNATRPETPSARIHAWLLRTVDSLDVRTGELCTAIEAGADNQQDAFAEARRLYKHIEAYAEMYGPETAMMLNGPPIDRYDEYDPERKVPPEGFQVVEEYLFPEPAPESRSDALLEARRLQSNVVRLKRMLGAVQLSESRVIEALRLQVFRIATMGITGFDSPVALASLRELIPALQGIAISAEILQNNASRPAFGWVAALCADAVSYVRANGDFDAFNRAEFIISRLDPILTALTRARDEYGIETVPNITGLAHDAETVFGKGTVDPAFFVPAYAQPMTEEKQELGRMLFFDPILSGNGDRSCATCHQPDRAFSDGLARSRALDGGTVQRNAPTVINAGYQSAFFYDMRVMYLEDQANDVIHNKDEMHGDLERAAEALRASSGYVAMFEAAFPEGEAEPVSGRNIRIALAAYIRGLSELDSRVDRYMRGEQHALTADEVHGFNLFMGKAKCATCHFPPLFNGAIPPRYAETEGEVIGVPSRPMVAHATVDPDPGKYPLYRMEKDRHLFKIPTVRNIALTAPYMHNGAYTTLEDVVDFYNRGGGTGIGIALPNITLPEDSLRLDKNEIRQIVRFMEALTDTTGLPGAPDALPKLGRTSTVSRNPQIAY